VVFSPFIKVIIIARNQPNSYYPPCIDGYQAIISAICYNSHSTINLDEVIMTKSYTDITKRISSGMKVLRSDISDTMQGFSAMAMAATKDGALDKKTKELIALAIGISTRCDGCIGFHTKALVDLGVTKAEFEETLGMAVYMGGGPSLMYAADALLAFDEFSKG
jgi:AhpD family alkylhydroperoxidase